jgi:hypothetical protein
MGHAPPELASLALVGAPVVPSLDAAVVADVSEDSDTEVAGSSDAPEVDADVVPSSAATSLIASKSPVRGQRLRIRSDARATLDPTRDRKTRGARWAACLLRLRCADAKRSGSGASNFAAGEVRPR